MAFTSTPRGARLARLFVAHCLDSWGRPYTSHVNETPTLIATELCANAMQHGRVPGRDFHVRPAGEADGGRLRVEVSDTRAERRPVVTAPADPDADSESGRGLLLVAALADDWGVTARRRGPGKTVRASLSVTHPSAEGSLERAARRCRPASRLDSFFIHVSSHGFAQPSWMCWLSTRPMAYRWTARSKGSVTTVCETEPLIRHSPAREHGSGVRDRRSTRC
ncbi:ATP-binding protein [Streptomyces sp. M2CJ-2]|uniref:ATP-binding protein n=1 Tax=Streptomyces sp. M2CJ-2 TaxID=2803948 RepID=UPI00192925CD|nr:ATP-binding protein [Streptomyces sp. M2CJ-2]MBL3671308.1 ATP-binding protein [Streptomyces sp. M2CJ-2]